MATTGAAAVAESAPVVIACNNVQERDDSATALSGVSVESAPASPSTRLRTTLRLSPTAASYIERRPAVVLDGGVVVPTSTSPDSETPAAASAADSGVSLASTPSCTPAPLADSGSPSVCFTPSGFSGSPASRTPASSPERHTPAPRRRPPPAAGRGGGGGGAAGDDSASSSGGGCCSSNSSSSSSDAEDDVYVTLYGSTQEAADAPSPPEPTEGPLPVPVLM